MKLNIKESIPSHEKNEIMNLEDEMYMSTPPVKEIKIFNESDKLKKSIKKRTECEEKFRHKFSKEVNNSYESAIKLLKTIARYKVPFEKMMLLATISTEITECVNNFWKDFEKVITSSMLNIDADDLMAIFIYLIVKSQLSELLIHTKFIEEFTTGTTKNSMMGYYYTTIKAALSYIASINDKFDLSNKDKKAPFTPNKSSFSENDTGEMNDLVINSNITVFTN
jgi:hypothetical protein